MKKAVKPMGEPAAWGGPMVMNTEEELNSGTFVKRN